MPQRRTDLALEAHALYRAAAKREEVEGLFLTERNRNGFRITEVRAETDAAANALEKPKGCYVTIDLAPLCARECGAADRAARILGKELRELLPEKCESALVVGLGNRAMTPDAIGPKCADHVLATRHLRGEPAFSALTAVSVLAPNVLGCTGMESAELVRGAVKTVRPDAVLAVDALCAQRLDRVCTTFQLTDVGIVPGSGVGNHRAALTRETLGVPVIAVGVPTVVDAATLVIDVLEEEGVQNLAPDALRGHAGVTVTLRDIDARVETLAKIAGWGIDLALQSALSLREVRELLS